MIWAALGYSERSEICFINGNIDSKTYIDILGDYYVPLEGENENNAKCLQQDNSPAHNSRLTKQ